ncbi:MAG TPA: maleylpyruvate isomerase family mycothiol-dependent enzyme [Acidimicrobiia bacterium]|nr:maleylpyruvate isomerase family mycothiol-dependent enzyme [Acidimicrobiia bacterium]
MDDLLVALADQHAELAEIVDGCSDADWDRPTRCEGWDVGAVLLHLAQTDEFARATAGGEFDDLTNGFLGAGASQTVTVDDAAAAQVDFDRGSGGDAIRRRWHDAAEAMRAAFETGDPHRRVTWVSGKLSLQTLAATRLSECWIHTGDIANALDIELPPTDRLRHIARLAWRTIPYAFQRADLAMAGPVALELIGPNGDQWRFDPDTPARTSIRGSAVEFCDVAARRVDSDATDLTGTGPDAAAVLRLVRTYAL